MSNAPHPTDFANRGTLMGHPVGLFLLFLVEMWERFSYYGMRGLLVLYLTSPTTGMRVLPPGREAGFNPGRGWDDASGNTAYGWYTGMAYLTPIVGGMIADKLIGTHRSMLVGGLMIAMGHVVLGISGIGEMASSSLGMSVFVFGLALIVIGTGHFKPSVSVMVGQLYEHADPRRETAFGIFYMGINLGSALQVYIVGTLGERYGWHWGFSAAAIGMLLGLGTYLFFRSRYLGQIGDPPGQHGSKAAGFIPVGIALAAATAWAFHMGWLTDVDTFVSNPKVVGVLAGLAGVWALWFTMRQKPGDKGPVATIIIFMLFNAAFWLAFEQAGSSINLFTDRFTDRNIGSWQVPTTWFQSVNPWLIIAFAPITGIMWTSLARRGKNPSQPVKIGIGLTGVGLGYLFLVWGATLLKTDQSRANMIFVIATYFLHTMGEIVLSPTGLSYVTKAAPRQHTSLLMGVWFISSFIANLLAGKVAAAAEGIKSKVPWNFGGYDDLDDFFFLFVVTSLAAALLVFGLTPLLKKLMRNPND